MPALSPPSRRQSVRQRTQNSGCFRFRTWVRPYARTSMPQIGSPTLEVVQFSRLLARHREAEDVLGEGPRPLDRQVEAEPAEPLMAYPEAGQAVTHDGHLDG